MISENKSKIVMPIVLEARSVPLRSLKEISSPISLPWQESLSLKGLLNELYVKCFFFHYSSMVTFLGQPKLCAAIAR